MFLNILTKSFIVYGRIDIYLIINMFIESPTRKIYRMLITYLSLETVTSTTLLINLMKGHASQMRTN